MGKQILTRRIEMRISQGIVIEIIKKIRSQPGKSSNGKKVVQWILMVFNCSLCLMKVEVSVKKQRKPSRFSETDREIMEKCIDS